MAGLSPGTIFAGRYRVVRPIAAGGMGAVYEVIHLETERRRALKVMHPHILQADDLRERFQREAKVAANIESEHIVDVFDAGFDAETNMPFLVMELLRGEELGRRLKRLGRLGPGEVVIYLSQAALALDKTHRANIVHRDLKPENFYLTEREDGQPRVKVLDFGIAKIVAESATSGATQSIGTPLYMAPEQFNPRAPLTPAADLYALAMVAYTLLVGSPYWFDEAKAGNIFALANVVGHGPREPASARAAARGVMLSPAFDAWFARATARDPAQRYQTATEMIAALGGALGVAPAVPMGPQAAPYPAPAEPAQQVPGALLGHVTGPGMSTTKQVPAAERRGIIVGAAIVGSLLAIAAAAAILWTRPSHPAVNAADPLPEPTIVSFTPVTTGPQAAPNPAPAEPAQSATGSAPASPSATAIATASASAAPASKPSEKEKAAVKSPPPPPPPVKKYPFGRLRPRSRWTPT
jgi:serine/threonine-protein kinase